MITVYTDGSCLKNPGPGGWAYYIPSLDVSESGNKGSTTNNEMELTACCRVLRFLSSHQDPIEIYTDSQYVQKGASTWMYQWSKNGWKTKSGEPIKNKELWQLLFELSSDSVTWIWVKAHTGNSDKHSEYNDIVDKMARDQASKVVPEATQATETETVQATQATQEDTDWKTRALQAEKELSELKKILKKLAK